MSKLYYTFHDWFNGLVIVPYTVMKYEWGIGMAEGCCSTNFLFVR